MGNSGANIMKYKKIIFSSVFIIFTLILIAFNKDVITKNPFMPKYTFSSPSNAYIDTHDNIYIVDRSGMGIIKGNKDGEIDFIIKGGTNSDKGFYNLGGITSSEDGRIFIHAIRFKGTSLYILDERILEYNGQNPDSGNIYIDKNGDISMAIYNKDTSICARKNPEDKTVRVEKTNAENCVLDNDPCTNWITKQKNN